MAIKAIERALREQSTLLVLDNMESALPPPFLAQEAPEVLSEEARAQLEAILALCDRLLKLGDARLVFTSRESLRHRSILSATAGSCTNSTARTR